MIVFKDKGLRVLRIDLATHADIAGTQITVRHVRRNVFLSPLDGVATPWAVLSMRGHNHPLFAQRMPAFFPGHLFWAMSIVRKIYRSLFGRTVGRGLEPRTETSLC